MDGLDELRQVQLDAALLTQRQTGRSTRRSLDTAAAYLLADFVQVLGDLSFSDHHPPLVHWNSASLSVPLPHTVGRFRTPAQAAYRLSLAAGARRAYERSTFM